MIKTTSIFYALLVLALVLVYLPPAASASGYSDYYGSCKKLSDRTIIISVFASDASTKWDWKKQADYTQYKETHRRLGIAVEWIRKQAKASGVNTDLLWDFNNTPYLYAEASFKENMQRITSSVYDIYQKWIDENGHLEFMKKHFKADSIIYAFYYNSPKSQNLGSYSFPTTGWPLDNRTEICVFFTRGINIITVPAAYAHELLHCFGGVDLYRANPNFYMSKEFIDWFQSRYPKDLYAVTYFGAQNEVNYELTDLSRYYLGLIPRPSMVDQWSLKKSDFELIGR